MSKGRRGNWATAHSQASTEFLGLLSNVQLCHWTSEQLCPFVFWVRGQAKYFLYFCWRHDVSMSERVGRMIKTRSWEKDQKPKCNKVHAFPINYYCILVTRPCSYTTTYRFKTDDSCLNHIFRNENKAKLTEADMQIAIINHKKMIITMKIQLRHIPNQQYLQV